MANYEIESINKDATKIPIMLLTKRHTCNVKYSNIYAEYAYSLAAIVYE